MPSTQDVTRQSDRDKKYAESIAKRYESLDTARSLFKTQWEEVATFVKPHRLGFISSQTPGKKNNIQIYDTTAPWASGELSASLHGLMTNPATRWFQMQTRNRLLMQVREVALWLEDVEDAIYDVFASPEANFNSQAHELYSDLSDFGTGIMLVEATPGIGPGVRYSTLYLGQCVIAENSYGRVDTLIRRFNMSVRAIQQKWGDEKLNDTLRKALLENPYKEFTILHEVRPRTDRDIYRLDGINKPWSSCYALQDEPWLLSESGFDDFPYLVPRWTKMAGEIYGRSPAMTALPDIKMVNKMAETIIRAAQKIVDPPLMVPDEGFSLPVRVTPAGLNFFRTGLSDNQMIKALETKGNINMGLDLINAVREQILRTFYQDRLKLAKEKVEMTRFEAEERAQENLRMMSPVTGRLETEFLNDAIGRTYAIKRDAGQLPKPPQILVDNQAELRVEYVSPLARAQKSGEAIAVQQAMNLMAPLIQVDPKVAQNFDGDEIARATPSWYGLSTKFLRSPQKVAQIRQQQAEAAAIETEKVDQAQGAKAAAELGKAGLVGPRK